jgi:hypothetical protein
VGAGIRAGGPKDRQGAEFIALLQAHGIHVRLGDTLGTSPCRASCGSHMIAFPAQTDSLFYISPRLYREAVTSHSEGLAAAGGLPWYRVPNADPPTPTGLCRSRRNAVEPARPFQGGIVDGLPFQGRPPAAANPSLCDTTASRYLIPPRWGSRRSMWPHVPRPLAWADIELPLWGRVNHSQCVRQPRSGGTMSAQGKRSAALGMQGARIRKP